MWSIDYDNDACQHHHDQEDYGPYRLEGAAEERAAIHNTFCVRGDAHGDCASVTLLSATAQADHERRRRVEVDA